MPRKGENIFYRKDGRWEGRYKKGAKDGKTQYGFVFGKTYEEAKATRDAAKAAFESRMVSPPFANAPPDSFRLLSDEWLQFLKPQIKTSSLNKYANVLDSFLIPEFGSLSITAINRNLVLSMITRLLHTGRKDGAGLSPKTVSSIYSVLKNVLDYAVREKKIQVSDIRNIPIKQSQKQLRVLSNTEQRVLSLYLLDHLTPCHLGILVCLYTGLRLGEICALKWKDISFCEQELYVSRAMQRIQCLHDREQRTEIQISVPKSSCSVRRIPLPDELFQLLVKERKEDEAYILTGTGDKFIEPRTLQNHFHSVLKECNISNAHFHSLRHTFATRCVELGFDVKSLSEILGHSSVNITMNRYVHPSKELKQRNMNMLSNLLAVSSVE